MGPADLHSRSKIIWDTRNVRWTDGRGDQELYKNAVSFWNAFHNALLETNSNRHFNALTTEATDAPVTSKFDDHIGEKQCIDTLLTLGSVLQQNGNDGR